MLKEVIDLICNIIIPFGIVIGSHLLGLKDSTAALLLNLLPITIVTISYYCNKPKIYIKILTSIKARTNVKFKFNYYSFLDFDREISFENFIQLYIDELKKYSPVKITDSEIGKFHSRVNLDVDCIRYEFNYNPETSQLNFSINSKITFKLFKKEINKAMKPFKEIATKSKFIAFCDSKNSISIEFLKVNKDSEIKNPLFNKIYSDFTVINASLKYKTKRNTIINFNNNSISFFSTSDIYDFVEDVIKQMKLIA